MSRTWFPHWLQNGILLPSNQAYAIVLRNVPGGKTSSGSTSVGSRIARLHRRHLRYHLQIMLSDAVSGNRSLHHHTASPCPLCAGSSAFLISRKARDGSPLSTVLCRTCGLARTDPMPSEQELAAYYRDEYRSDYKGVTIPRTKHVLRAARLACHRLALLSPLLPPGASVLDLGAGGGEFVYLAGKAGFRARGVEPNAGYANYASQTLGLDIVPGTWQSHHTDAGSLGAVTMFHVLEHLPAPLACLRRLHLWLQPDGVLIVEVPHLLPGAGNPRNRFHRAHLLHFTPETLTLAFHLAGFDVLFAKTSSDDGNILVAGRKVADPASSSANPASSSANPASSSANPANPSLVERILHWETSRPAIPYLHPRAWLRFLNKIKAAVEERQAASSTGDRLQILAAVAALPPPDESALSLFWRSATIRP
jgi:SAM-dependent methyltransferase